MAKLILEEIPWQMPFKLSTYFQGLSHLLGICVECPCCQHLAKKTTQGHGYDMTLSVVQEKKYFLIW